MSLHSFVTLFEVTVNHIKLLETVDVKKTNVFSFASANRLDFFYKQESIMELLRKRKGVSTLSYII